MNTLLLDRTTWDLCLDSNGNIAVASNPYSTAQDAASAVKLFQGELWYDTSQGVPYFQKILGKRPPLQLIKNAINAAALTVSDVVSAATTITAFDDRTLSGQLQVTDVVAQQVVLMNFSTSTGIFNQSEFGTSVFG